MEEHVEKTIAEYENRIEQIDAEIGENDSDKVLDEEREQSESEDVYTSDRDAQSEGFDTAEKGNEHWENFWAELKSNANRGVRVESQVVEDLASRGMTKKEIYEVVHEYEELNEELATMFGGE